MTCMSPGLRGGSSSGPGTQPGACPRSGQCGDSQRRPDNTDVINIFIWQFVSCHQSNNITCHRTFQYILDEQYQFNYVVTCEKPPITTLSDVTPWLASSSLTRSLTKLTDQSTPSMSSLFLSASFRLRISYQAGIGIPPLSVTGIMGAVGQMTCSSNVVIIALLFTWSPWGSLAWLCWEPPPSPCRCPPAREGRWGWLCAFWRTLTPRAALRHSF